MAARTVAVHLKLEVGSYLQGAKNAAAATRDLATQTTQMAQKNKKEWDEVGRGMLAFGAVAAAGLGLAVKKFADFDAQMSAVQAATHESALGMQALKDAALDAGARTAFSATEAAQGIEELAKAGVSTESILNGGLNGALDLAAAGALDVGEAAEIAATAMTQFRLSGDKVPHVADLLSAAAGKAQGSVSDMGMALKQSGLVASQVGLSIEETTTALAAFASAGLIGSDAGTSLKSMLQRLTPQSAEAARMMDDLGISAYDAQGNFIGLEALAENLQTQMAGLTVESRNSAMATIFGSDAVRAASVLYQQGGEGVAKWAEQVNDSGYAAETAGIRMDNLKGDVERLGGSLETAFIGAGSKGNGVLRALTQTAEGAVNTFAGLPGPVQTAGVAIGGVAATVGLVGGASMLAVNKVAQFRDSLDTLGVSGKKAAAAMVGTAGLTAALAVLMHSIGQAQKEAGFFAEEVSAAGDSPREKIRLLKAEIEELGKTESKGFQLFDAVYFNESAKTAADRIDALRAQIELLEHQERVAAAEGDGLATSQGEMGGAVAGATTEIVDQEQALNDLIESVRGLSDQVLGLRGSERDFEAALDAATESVKANGRTLDITTEAGRNNSAALDGIAQSANEVAESMLNSGAPIETVRARIEAQRGALYTAALQFGMTEDQARQYVDQVLRIPTARTTTVTAQTAAASESVRQLRERLDGLRDRNVTVTVTRRVAGDNSFGGNLALASGGWVSGPGTGTSDSIPARLSNGEFVVNARSAAQHGALLEAINTKRFATGGWVGGTPGNSGGSTSLDTAGLARSIEMALSSRPMVLQIDGRDVVATIRRYDRSLG